MRATGRPAPVGEQPGAHPRRSSTRSWPSWPPPRPEERAELPGLDPARADIILAGALILEQVMHELGLDELLVSDYALREGVLLDAWQRRHGGSLHHLSDLRRRSVVDLAELMDEDPAHSAQVARLALDAVRRHRRPPRPRRRRPRDPRGGRAALQRRAVPLPRPAPQAQLLRDPRHRPAGRLHRPRGRAHRAGGPLPPQVRAEGQARRVRGARRRRPAPRPVPGRALRVAIGLDRNHAVAGGRRRAVDGRRRPRWRCVAEAVPGDGHQPRALRGRLPQGPARGGARTCPSRSSRPSDPTAEPAGGRTGGGYRRPPWPPGCW